MQEKKKFEKKKLDKKDNIKIKKGAKGLKGAVVGIGAITMAVKYGKDIYKIGRSVIFKS